MTDLPIIHSPSENRAEKITDAFLRLLAMFHAARKAMDHVPTRNLSRRAMRRTPDEILAAQARREEARRAVDRLLR
jgi:hypothetical protein